MEFFFFLFFFTRGRGIEFFRVITLAGVVGGGRVTFDEMRTCVVSIFLIARELNG